MNRSKEAMALQACRDLYQAKQAIKLITEQIGECFQACPPAGKDTRLPLSHLEQAYAWETGEFGMREYLEQGERNLVLSQCPHCLRAHQLIQERKLLRIELGKAKRRVTMIGKSA